jgi:hypothetical protein
MDGKPLGGVLRSVLRMYTGVSSKFTLKCIVWQTGSITSSAIGRVFESIPGSILENILGWSSWEHVMRYIR